MNHAHTLAGRKRPVNLSLNEELVARARRLTRNLSEQVEALLGAYVAEEEARRARTDAAMNQAIDGWNEFSQRVGSFADEHSTL